VQQRVFTVFYEDLCRDVHGVLQRICSSLDLACSDSFFVTLPETLPITNARWIDTADASAKRTMNEVIGDTLTDYGYEPFDV